MHIFCAIVRMHGCKPKCSLFAHVRVTGKNGVNKLKLNLQGWESEGWE